MQVQQTEPDSAGAPARQQDERFAALHRELYPRIYAYVMRRTMDTTAADEIAAETLEVRWRRREEPIEDETAWVLGVARRLLANRHRAERRSSQLDERLADEWMAESPDHASAIAERSELLAALSGLSESDREVLILLAWDGLDRTQVARVLGCSRAALAVRLHRARRRFEAQLAMQREPRNNHGPEEVSR